MTTERLPSWREVAEVLAQRMEHAASAAGSVPPDLPADRHDIRGCSHPEIEADPGNCPFCADRAAYRLWEKKAGRR